MKVTAVAEGSPGWDLVEMHLLNASLGDAAGQRANAPRGPANTAAPGEQRSLALVHPQWRPFQWRRPRTCVNQGAERDPTVGLHEDAGLPDLHATRLEDRLYGRVPADNPVDQPIRPEAAHRARTGSEWSNTSARAGAGVQPTATPSSPVVILNLVVRIADRQRKRCLNWMMPMGSTA